MRSTVVRVLAAILLWLGCLTSVAAEGSLGGELSDDEIVERILDLRRELDSLLAALPAEVRQEIDRRLAATEPTLPPAPEAATTGSGSEAAIAEPLVEAAVPAPAAEGCAELSPFDTNADGTISGFDRYWRLFRLWRDDGDGEVEPAEVVGLYDAGVREFSTAVRRYETVDGVVGDVREVGGWITFERVGKKGGDAALMIDADRLRRGGELTLVDSDGAPVLGLQRLGETSMLSSAGGLVRLSCP